MKKLILAMLLFIFVWVSFWATRWDMCLYSRYWNAQAVYMHWLINDIVEWKQESEKLYFLESFLSNILNLWDVYKDEPRTLWTLCFLYDLVNKDIRMIKNKNNTCTELYVFQCLFWQNYDECIKPCQY